MPWYPEPVRVHDFEVPELGKVAPYGVYDIAANHGWVSVGVDADTAAFAVESIRRWWYATSDRLATAFGPAVDRAMANTGVEHQFNNLRGSAPALPFGKPDALDINHYVLR